MVARKAVGNRRSVWKFGSIWRLTYESFYLFCPFLACCSVVVIGLVTAKGMDLLFWDGDDEQSSNPVGG